MPELPDITAFDFPEGSLTLTEAGTQRRASLHVVQGDEGLHSMDPGGIDVLASSPEEFRAALTAENHTLKRSARGFSREGDGLSGRHGGAWVLREAVPGVRREDPAYPIRRQRN
jgi:hypothetical protein